MADVINVLLLGTCAALTTGCAIGKSESFTLTADLPTNFTYSAVAKYVPATGESCAVTISDKPNISFNSRWWHTYKLNAEIPLYRTVKGCLLVVRDVDIAINGTYGEAFGDSDYSKGSVIAIRETLAEQTKGNFDRSGTSTFEGQCEWLFRTQGTKRRLSKSIKCVGLDAQGARITGLPFAAYTLDQLPGRTVKFKIALADEERPSWGDTWVKFPNGWKRCLGKGMEDQRGYCSGNYKDFSSFIMPDGRSCTIYPDCTE